MTTIDVKQTVDIYDLIRMCWGSAKDFLQEVLDAEKDDLLMDFLNDIYQDGGEAPDLVELNDLFSFDQDELKKDLGMNEEDEDEGEDED